MKRLRLKVKKEIILWDDYAPEGKEEFTLNVGEEYDVNYCSEEEARFGMHNVVFTEGHHGWNDMDFDSNEEFWEYWEQI